MARYRKIKWNDITNGDGICVSLWFQGCPIHCKGCHNQDLWDFEGGDLITESTIDSIVDIMNKDGVKRNLSILGGEPLCKENIDTTIDIITAVKVRTKYYTPKVYLWTGYDLCEDDHKYFSRKLAPYIEYDKLHSVVQLSDFIIFGHYDESKRDIRLKFGGSTNQKIILKDEDGDVVVRDIY